MSLATVLNSCLMPLNLRVVRESSLRSLIQTLSDRERAHAATSGQLAEADARLVAAEARLQASEARADAAEARADAADARTADAARRSEVIRQTLSDRLEAMSTQLCDALAGLDGPALAARYPALAGAEAAAAAGDPALAWGHLRTLSLPVFGALLLGVPSSLPALAAWLPTMAADQVQRDWTGTAGFPLLAQSLSFVQGLEQGMLQVTGRPLAGLRVLDYGCGWGRLLRLMSWYVDPARLVGIDPWDQSIALCRDHRVMAELAVGDYVPRDLPVAGPYDLIYAYSVFTHLSEKTADAVLGCLRRHVAADGMLAVTIRPAHYWDDYVGPELHWDGTGHKDRSAIDRAALKRRHLDRGFAFLAHALPPIDGDVTYGDTSMSLEFLARRWPQWRVAGTRALPADPLQLVVFLTPA